MLIPVWLIVVGMWAHAQTASLLHTVALAFVLTILTQDPWTKMTDVQYFASWFPYSVYTERVSGLSVSRDFITSLWRMRVLVATRGLAAFVAWSRRGASSLRP